MMRQAIREHDAHRAMRKGWPYLLVVIGAVLLGLWCQSTAESARHASEAAHRLSIVVARQQEKTVDGLIKVCRNNGNPLRRAVRKQIQKQINNPNDPKLLEIFSNVPPASLEKLIRESNREARQELTEIKTLNCVTQYR